MSALVLVVGGLGLYFIAYKTYSKFIATKIYALSPTYKTPAHEFEDGTDFVPTNKFVLWGHHFTSVAGAAPIVGPAIAIFWGWLPAALWVVFGTIFFAGIHDFGTIWISGRHKGRSIGAISETQIGVRARSLFMVVIFLLLLMVNAVFAIIIARLFVANPGSVVPIWFQIPVAMAVGVILHKKGGKLLVPSLIALAILYFWVWLGTVMPFSFPERTFLGLAPQATWVVLLFVYAGIASLLPVWLLLQPRDYVNSHQLFVALGVLYLGVIVGNPSMSAPAINPDVAGAPSIIPFLFITIACGAISGFHGLVSSGTTSKQLDKETDARFVGYFGSLGEGILALGAIIATGAGLAATRGEWAELYSSWGAASGGAGGFFVAGFANLGTNIGLPLGFATVLGSVVVISFAATTMDTGLRLQRYILSEVGEMFNVPVLRKNVVATTLAAGSCLALAFGATAAGAEAGSGGLVIWPLFGTTNQLLAALSLVTITVYLRRLGRNILPALIPMAFLLLVTVVAMTISIFQWFGLTGQTPNLLLAIMGSAILIAALWMMVEAVIAIRNAGSGGGGALGAETAPNPGK